LGASDSVTKTKRIQSQVSFHNSASPIVSIILAAYNAEAFMTRAVESALIQSGPPLELIIVDDASTDGTFALASHFAQSDTRVRPIRLETNSGPAAARNAAIDVARGAWIAVLDADDAMAPGRIAALVDFAQRESLDIVADNFWFWDLRGQTAIQTAFECTSQFKIVDLHEYLSNTQASFDSTDWGLLKPMFRREFLQRKKLKYPATRHGEDFMLLMACLLDNAKFGLLGEPGYFYTTRASGFSRTFVDYGGMLAQCETLLRHDAIKRDRSLARLVRSRAISVQSLAAHHHCYGMLDGHAYGQIALELCWNQHLWRAVLRSADLRHELLGVLQRKLQKTLSARL